MSRSKANERNGLHVMTWEMIFHMLGGAAIPTLIACWFGYKVYKQGDFSKRLDLLEKNIIKEMGTEVAGKTLTTQLRDAMGNTSDDGNLTLQHEGISKSIGSVVKYHEQQTQAVSTLIASGKEAYDVLDQVSNIKPLLLKMNEENRKLRKEVIDLRHSLKQEKDRMYEMHRSSVAPNYPSQSHDGPELELSL